MEKNTKTYLIATAIAITSFATGVVVTNEDKTVYIAPNTAIEYQLSLKENDPSKDALYTLSLGNGFFYQFDTKEQIEEFANRIDAQDDQMTIDARRIVKQELQSKTVDEFINELKQ